MFSFLCVPTDNGNAICPNGTVQDQRKYCPENGRCLVTHSQFASVPCIQEIQDEPRCSEEYYAYHVCKGNNLCPP